MRAFSLALLVAVFGTVASAQEPVVILDNNVTRTLDCHGGTGSVNGNSNILTFRNCATIAVNGNSNTVDAGAVVSLSLIGGSNKVTYALAADGRPPKIANLGSGNTVTQRAAGELPRAAAGAAAAGTVTAAGTAPATTGGASTTTINSGGLSTSNGKSTVDINASGITIGGATHPAPVAAAPAAPAPQAAGVAGAKAPLVISDNNLHQDFDCGSGSAVVGGNGSVITLRNCAVVTVNGNDNTITTTGTPAITLNGNRNQVQWTESADGKIPRVADRGNGNRVSKKP